jgi:hypothetical protein
MADPTTIFDYATQRRDQTKLAVTAAQQRLAQAQSNSAADEAKVTTATKELADLEKKIADIRKKLSAIPTPADGDLLLQQLEQAIIDSRTKQAEVLAAQTALAAAQSEANLAQSDLAIFSAQLTSAEARLKQADPATQQRAMWIAALAGPLATLKTEATNAATVGVVKVAEKRITDDIPAKLLTRAVERRTAEAARIANTTAEREAAEAAAPDPRAALLRRESATRDFVNTAQSRLDQARTKLAQVADKTNSPLTTEQIAAINALDPSALKDAREAGLVAEKKRDDKLKDLTDKQALRDAAILAAIISNTAITRKAVTDANKDVADSQTAFDLEDATWRAGEKVRDSKVALVATRQAELAQAIQKAIADKKDPDTDLGVKTARDKLKTAQDDLQAKEVLYKQSNHGILHAWEAAVPETTWQLLDDYEGALEILNTMPNPVTLSASLLAAETAYVQAQLAVDASATVQVDLLAEQAERAAREEGARQTSATSLFGALRGDN